MKGQIWLVRCPDYTSEHRSQEAAETAKARIEQFGQCRLEHEVVPPKEAE